ncbi:phosphatidylcholine/phosphatidylserine synthase [Gordonia sp. zg691]|uniref:Phosphatidylcholine/phosphatidylserine synthase n=1 Tax=Gordonia jinghuaiqii TaxID=2758710 RepID=A0A7D7QIC1_9ACTN|nr:phosphatidylcholine/phosphatidylserine synthase [Gordonia jinghuaiqii]MBD0861581.1 phosphatidylcholine/phosphatidylserine synthase [Gordonia jinghuaiqii]MCR5977452.1 phosphatidylcholine/phosphatidylserine synthase [Gordonia jinghuaiqii]QMT02144.1 phosphatidylcholine/phosphatidylserine synthase [Gordonia jinghuaiqii]
MNPPGPAAGRRSNARTSRTPTARSARRQAQSTQSAAPEVPERRRLRRQAQAGRILVPSSLTILAICAGLTAMRMATTGEIAAAMGLLVAAAFLDGIDGRVARLMGATSRMGAEIDSLADAINFGVVPAMIIYFHLLDGHDLGWALALVYCCAIVLRLARFNTLLDDDEAPAYTRDFFVGVPAPAAAICALLPIGLEQQFGEGWWTSLPAVGGWLVLLAYLAISRIPTSSLKTAKIPPGAIAGLMVLVAVCAALLVTFPYVLMMIVIAGYAIHIPFAWRARRWVASRPEFWNDKPAERRAQRRELARTSPGGRRRRPVLNSMGRLGLNRPTGASAQRPGTESDRG